MPSSVHHPEEEVDAGEGREERQKDTRFFVLCFELLDGTLPAATFLCTFQLSK